MERLAGRDDAGRPAPRTPRADRRARADPLLLRPPPSRAAWHRRLGAGALRLRRLRRGDRLEALPRPLLPEAPLGLLRLRDPARERARLAAERRPVRRPRP